MYELIELCDTQPHIKKINMEFKNIRDLAPMIAVLAKFRNLSELSLHGNKISAVPALDNIRNLRAIDLTNNPIKIDKNFLDRLHNTPRLEDLYIDCSREQSELIVQSAPNLKTLNDQFIIRERFVRQSLEEELKALQSKLADEMKKMKETYARLSAIFEQSNSDGETESKSRLVARDQEVNLIYKDIQEQMGYFYSGLQDRLSREGVFAYCKNKLTAVLDNLMVKILDQNASETVVKIYEEVSRIKSENFDLLLRIIFNASFERHVNQEVDKPTNRLRKETVYQNEIFRLKKQLMEVRQEQAKLQNIAQKQQNILLEKKVRPALATKSPRNLDRCQSAYRIPKHSPSAKTLTRVTTLNRSPSVKVTPTNKASLSNITLSPTASHRQKKGSGKILSLQQLSKLVEELMAQKRKFNLRALSKNESFETSEEFIFTFFTRKYGLKEVALQWSLSVIKAIEQYCKEAIQVQVFGKILKNHLYEEYYDEYRQFSRDIERVYKESRMDRNCIQETAFRRVFFYFFSYQNEDTFQKIVKTFNFPIRAPELTYFLQSYKLAFEEKQLAPFLQIFQRADSDDDSALTAKEAKEVLAGVVRLNKNLSEDAIALRLEEYLGVIDTFKKNKFIFSEVFQIAHKLL